MVCSFEFYKKPELNDPVLVEGLPGIGFVANIAALHLIRELDAERFAEIHSSAFQDITVTIDNGDTLSPVNELYYHKDQNNSHDLIIWYGNTQALTTPGQYELCGRVLDVAQELGCRCVVTLGGFRQEEIKTTPQIYCAASDLVTLNEALKLDLHAKIMVGQIFGIAGLMVGLAQLRGLRSLSLLVETLGLHPDANGARSSLLALSRFLNMDIDLSNVDLAAEETKRILESFGLIKNVREEKKKEEQRFRWFI